MKDNAHAWIIAFINPGCTNCRRFSQEWGRLQLM